VVASLLTVLEIAGLLLVIGAGAPVLGDLPSRYAELLPPFEWTVWSGIVSGAILAFYAFIGFESMVNVSEEVKDVRRTLPRAIMLTLAITGALYLSLALIAVLALPPAAFAGQRAPLAFLFERLTGTEVPALRVIGTLSALNGAFIEIIVAARILFGLSTERWLPHYFGRVNPRTQTPLFSTALVVLVMLLLALFVPIEALAQATALITLAVFAVASLALLRIKRREAAPHGVLVVPAVVPLAGFAISLAFLVLELINQLGG
jgi:amino acid transporter